MIINIGLTGIAREITGKKIITVEIKNPDGFHSCLLEALPGLKNYSYQVSVNGKLTNDLSLIDQKDNIMVFSPIAGG